MQTVSKIWMDGKLVDWKDAKIHIITHALHYGSGVFEGIRFYKTKKGPAIFRLDKHTDRLFYSAQVFEMKLKFTKEEINQAIKDTIKINKIEEGYIRPLIYFGEGVMGLNPDKAPVNTAIAVWGWGKYLGKDIVDVKVSSYIRIHPQSCVNDAKVTGHYVNSILASREAKKAGYDEAILLDFEGNIAEGPGENIFIVKDKKLLTPSEGNILPGITRDAIMKIAVDSGYEVDEVKLSLEDLKKADEAFFTGTAAEITAIGKVDNTTINQEKIGPITKELKEKFEKVIKGEDPKYEDWLFYV